MCAIAIECTIWNVKTILIVVFSDKLSGLENSCKNCLQWKILARILLTFFLSRSRLKTWAFLSQKKPDKVTIPMKYIFFSRVFLQPMQCNAMQWFLAISYCNESLEEQGISCAAPYAMAAAMFSVKALVQSYGITHFQTGSPWPPFGMFRLGRKKCKSMVFYQPLFWGLKKG